MKTWREIKYRWVNFGPSLPGELEPTKEGAVMIWCSPVEEMESNLFLRHIRALLFGYGPGWTFRDALVDWGAPKFMILALLFSCSMLLYALRGIFY